jgi:excisionase family DNA binding protein
MHQNNNQPGVPGYVSIKETAKLLGLSPSRVYEYVEDGRLPSVRAAHVILIPLEVIRNFAPGIAGRPRKSPLRWRFSPENNSLLSISIVVRVRPGKQANLMKRLAEIKESEQYLFPGTVARFIMMNKTDPEQLEISLIWRSTAMPDERTRKEALEDFRQILADVLDWENAHYSDSIVLMHT